MKKIVALLIAALFFAAPVQGQQKDGTTVKVYEVKWQKAEDIAKLLIGMDVELIPGSINASFNTFTVRATAQGHAAVADLIQKFDVPKKTVEFQFFLIKATRTGEGLKDDLPTSVRGAIADIARLTRYSGFELIGTPFFRVEEGKTSQLEGKGYRIDLRSPVVTTEGNKHQISISMLSVFYMPGTGTVSTSFSMAEGEVVVIGASGSGNGQEGKEPGSAMISIVTAKVL